MRWLARKYNKYNEYHSNKFEPKGKRVGWGNLKTMFYVMHVNTSKFAITIPILNGNLSLS